MRTLRALSAYQVYELTQLKTNRVYKGLPLLKGHSRRWPLFTAGT
ncbi:hypothetical protein ARTHRO8AJ_20040 [Arthrobacter sp. 8AJ]|nr:hypothetical protein ARTHRO8AJ_20040 [Arthrobacter sp. 8AJ]